MDDTVSAIPIQGVGIGYRREIAKQIFAAIDALDVVEIITEQFLDSSTMGELEHLCSCITVLPHGVGLSVGSSTLADKKYLRSIKRIVDQTGAAFYSEHLCMTRAPGIDLGHLTPLAFTPVTLARTIDHVQQVQEFLGRPLILENISHLFKINAGGMNENEFFQELIDRTCCGILLDVSNIYANAANFGHDPAAILRRMPLDRVVQVHLAGGFWADGFFVDGHSHDVSEPSWPLLAELAQATTVKACIVERDTNLPEDIAPLLAEVARARHLILPAASAPERAARERIVV